MSAWSEFLERALTTHVRWTPQLWLLLGMVHEIRGTPDLNTRADELLQVWEIAVASDWIHSLDPSIWSDCSAFTRSAVGMTFRDIGLVAVDRVATFARRTRGFDYDVPPGLRKNAVPPRRFAVDTIAFLAWRGDAGTQDAARNCLLQWVHGDDPELQLLAAEAAKRFGIGDGLPRAGSGPDLPHAIAPMEPVAADDKRKDLLATFPPCPEILSLAAASIARRDWRMWYLCGRIQQMALCTDTTQRVKRALDIWSTLEEPPVVDERGVPPCWKYGIPIIQAGIVQVIAREAGPAIAVLQRAIESEPTPKRNELVEVVQIPSRLLIAYIALASVARAASPVERKRIGAYLTDIWQTSPSPIHREYATAASNWAIHLSDDYRPTREA